MANKDRGTEALADLVNVACEMTTEQILHEMAKAFGGNEELTLIGIMTISAKLMARAMRLSVSDEVCTCPEKHTPIKVSGDSLLKTFSRMTAAEGFAVAIQFDREAFIKGLKAARR